MLKDYFTIMITKYYQFLKIKESHTFNNYNGYELIPIIETNEKVEYEFVSIGKKEIIKRVTFEILEENIFVLTFGDYNSRTNKITMNILNENGDVMKILASVFRAIDHFFIKRNKDVVLFWGYDKPRRKYFSKFISYKYSEISIKYQVFGKLIDTDLPEEYVKDKEYNYYILALKK